MLIIEYADVHSAHKMRIFKGLGTAIPLSILLWGIIILAFAPFVSSVAITETNLTSVGGTWVYVNATMNATAVDIGTSCVNFTNLIFNQTLTTDKRVVNLTANNSLVNFSFCDGNGYYLGNIYNRTTIAILERDLNTTIEEFMSWIPILALAVIIALVMIPLLYGMITGNFQFNSVQEIFFYAAIVVTIVIFFIAIAGVIAT